MTSDYPANVARALIQGDIDMGLVPIAIIPKLKEYFIVGNYGIGANGEVASVCIFSQVPMEEVKTVMLDYQSRTSVELARILLAEYWKSSAEVVHASTDFREHIKGTTAGLVIGDRALEQRKISPYIYDLGAAWKQHTGLPFIFAAWISNKKLDKQFIELFNAANAAGIHNLSEVVNETPYHHYDLLKYYTKNIQYHLNDQLHAGLKLFLSKLTQKETAIIG